MKRILLLLLCSTLLVSSLAANSIKLQEQLIGTWSGSWTPGGIYDAMTIELKRDESGKMTGRFLNPSAMNFSKVTFNSSTRTLLLEATDAASGKKYTLNGKLEGNEIKGTVASDTEGGPVDLIKWTYVPTVKW